MLALIYYAVTSPDFLVHGGGNSKISRAKSDIAELSGAVDQFRLDCERYPTTKEGLAALKEAPKGAKGWNGPYLQANIPDSPEGQSYQYRNPGPGGTGYEIKTIVNNEPITGGSDN